MFQASGMQEVCRSISFLWELAQRKDQQIKDPQIPGQGVGTLIGLLRSLRRAVRRGGMCVERPSFRHVGMGWRLGGWGQGWVRVQMGESEA